VIAVPVYPPDPSSLKRGLMKLSHTVKGSGARYALTNSTYMRATYPLRSVGLEWIDTTSVDGVKASHSFTDNTLDLSNCK